MKTLAVDHQRHISRLRLLIQKAKDFNNPTAVDCQSRVMNLEENHHVQIKHLESSLQKAEEFHQTTDAAHQKMITQFESDLREANDMIQCTRLEHQKLITKHENALRRASEADKIADVRYAGLLEEHQTVLETHERIRNEQNSALSNANKATKSVDLKYQTLFKTHEGLESRLHGEAEATKAAELKYQGLSKVHEAASNLNKLLVLDIGSALSRKKKATEAQQFHYQDLLTSQSTVLQLEQNIIDLNARIEELGRKVSASTGSITRLTSELSTLQDQHDGLLCDNGRLCDETTELNATISIQVSQLSTVEVEREGLKDNNGWLLHEMTDTTAREPKPTSMESWPDIFPISPELHQRSRSSVTKLLSLFDARPMELYRQSRAYVPLKVERLSSRCRISIGTGRYGGWIWQIALLLSMMRGIMWHLGPSCSRTFQCQWL